MYKIEQIIGDILLQLWVGNDIKMFALEYNDDFTSVYWGLQITSDEDTFVSGCFPTNEEYDIRVVRDVIFMAIKEKFPDWTPGEIKVAEFPEIEEEITDEEE